MARKGNTLMRIKLRTKLLVFALALVLVSLGIAAPPLILSFRDAQRSATLEEQERIANSVAEEISHFLHIQFLGLRGADFLLFPGFMEDEALRKMLIERALFKNKAFIDLVLVDSEGEELTRQNRYRVIRSSELGNRFQSQEFQITKEQGYYLGPLYFEEGRPLFTLGVAIIDANDRLVSIAIAEIDARIMQEVVLQTTIARAGGRTFIVNKEGIVVAHPNFSEVLAKQNFSFLPIVDALKQNNPFSSIYQNEINEKVLGAWAPIMMTFDEVTATRWYIVAEENASYAMRHVNRAIWFGLGSLVFAFIFAAIGAWFISRLIVRPIELVHRAVARFGHGKFAERVYVKTGDEIKDLADGFNQMADKIMVYTNTLKRERDQTSAIVASLGDGLIMYSPEKKIIFLNPKAQEMLWVSSKQVLGKSLRNESAFRTSLLENFYNISTLLLKNWETKEYTTKAPRKVVLEVTRIALKGPKGKNLGSMRILHDITKEKEVEAIRSEFVSLASHQLRTPLSGMRWSLKMLLEGDFGKLGPKQRDIIGGTLRSNDRLIGIVNDLLDVSRIEAGRFDYNFSSQSLEDLTDTLLKEFSQQIRRKKLQFSYEKPKAPLPKVNIDSEKMEMALQNIIDNALKYTLEEDKIEIYFEKSATHLAFIVKDTGIGIPKDQQSRVFDKFFRASNAVKLQTEGSGLGLFIAKSIIEVHRGEISFVSEANKGSTFRISLPIDPKLMPKKKK